MWQNNYSEARNCFREYCLKTYHNYDKSSGNFLIDRDQETTIDYLLLQHPKSTKLHILISGTHGVEGYAGSAIQFKTLENILNKSESSSETPISYLMVHALNPYGYRYNRRCTKNNIDLNRNYLESNNFYETDYPYQIFKLVSTYLYSFSFIYLFFSILFEYGYTKAREYVVKGQYSYKQGLFYGGNKKEQNITVLENLLSTIDYTPYEDVYIFDIHTGLGNYGNLSIMVFQEETVKTLTNLPYNIHTKLINMNTNNMYKESKGSIVDGIYEYLSKKEEVFNINPIILEYGTYSNLWIFTGLLLENYNYCNTLIGWKDASKNLKSLFHINNKDWQELVIENYLDFIQLLK